jgi:hypothetical protein
MGEREVHHRGPDPDVGSLAQKVRHHVDGIGAGAIVEEVLLGHPHAVEAEFLGVVHARQLIGQDLFRRGPGRNLEGVIRPELHFPLSPFRTLSIDWCW